MMYPFFYLFTVLLLATRNKLVGLIAALPMLYFLARIVMTHVESANHKKSIQNREFTVEHMTLSEFSTERIF